MLSWLHWAWHQPYNNNLQPQNLSRRHGRYISKGEELVGQLARRVGELRKRAEWNADLLVSLLPGEGDE